MWKYARGARDVVGSVGRAGAALAMVIGLTIPSAVGAQSHPIVPDRPGMGSGTHVLSSGRVVVETGFQTGFSGAVETYDLGQLLVRIGVSRLEFQAILNSYALVDGPGVNLDGFRDPGLGVKVPVVSSDGGNLSVLGTVLVPLGADPLSSGEWVPGITLLADRPLSARASVAVNLGWSAGPGVVESTYAVIVTPALSVGERTSAYGGYAGFYAASVNQHFVEAGAAFLVRPHIQLDLNGGWEVETADVFVGVGVAFRMGSR